MATFALSYGFAADGAGSIDDPAFSASAVTKSAASPSLTFTGGEAVFVPGAVASSSLATREARYITITVGPDNPAQPWTPGTLTFKERRGTSDTSNGWIIRTSADGFSTNVGSGSGAGTTFITRTVDLSTLGEITGPLEIRWWSYASSTSTSMVYDDITFSGTYESIGQGPDQDVLPVGIPSGEAFGAPVYLVLFPVGIPSGEAFGTIQGAQPPAQTMQPAGLVSALAFGPVLVANEGAPPDLVLLPGGIASLESFGEVTLLGGDVPPVTGLEVATFMGQEDNDYIRGIADEAVRIITSLARTYTRGRGFEPLADDLRDVIIIASARLVGNPGQTQQWVGSNFIQSGFQGWSLAEQLIMNQYRKRVAA